MTSNILRSAILLAGLLGAASSLATPVQSRGADPCAGITGGTSTLTGTSWQLHAANVTGGSDVQLVLGSAGATPGSALYVLAVSGTSAIDGDSDSDFTPGTGFFNLTRGGITAFVEAGKKAPVLNTIDTEPLGLTTTSLGPPATPALAWCALPAARGQPSVRPLAVSGSSTLFSLCPDNIEGQTVVGHNITGLYGCYAVNLFMVHSD